MDDEVLDMTMRWWNTYASLPQPDLWGQGDLQTQTYGHSSTNTSNTTATLRIGIFTDNKVTSKLAKAFMMSNRVSFLEMYSVDIDPAMVLTSLDVAFFHGYSQSLSELIGYLRKMNPSIRIFYWLTSPEPKAYSLDVDIFFTNSRLLVSILNRSVPTFFMPFAGDVSACDAQQEELQRVAAKEKTINATDSKIFQISCLVNNKGKRLGPSLLLESSQDFGLNIFGWTEARLTALSKSMRGEWKRSDEELYLSSRIFLAIPSVHERLLGMLGHEVFDSLACGTPVLSGPLPWDLEPQMKRFVFVPANRTEARQMMQYLLGSSKHPQHSKKWFAEYKVAAQRFITGGHSYSDRAAFVLAAYDRHIAGAFSSQNKQHSLPVSAHASTRARIRNTLTGRFMHPMLEPLPG